MGKACLRGLEPSRIWSPKELHCWAWCEWRSRWVSTMNPPSSWRASDLAGEPRRVSSLPDPGQAILDRGLWGSFALPTC